jgi:CRISPR-associated protein Csh1
MKKSFGIYEDLEFLNTDVKKALFLIGVLAEEILEVESKKHSQSFLKEDLKSLNLNKEDIIKLLPAIKYKLEELEELKVNKPYYDLILAEIFKKLLQSGFHDSLNEINKTDLNFIITCGIALKDEVIQKIKNSSN